MYFETQRWLIEHYYGWDEKREIAAFAKQFEPDASYVIDINGQDEGWLQYRDHEDLIEIEGIYISSNQQARGIGTKIIRSLIKDADARRKSLILSAGKINPAIELYKRLGFRIIQEEARKVSMRRSWAP